MVAGAPSGVIDLAAAGDGSVWAVSGNGDTGHQLVPSDPWTEFAGSFAHIAAAKDGSVWALRDGTFARYDPLTSGWTPLSSPPGLTRVYAGSQWSVFGLAGDQAGELWSYDPGSDTWLDLSLKLVMVSALADGTVWGLDQNFQPGYMARGESWTSVPLPPSGVVSWLDAATDTWVWIVDGNSTVWQYETSVDPPWVELDVQPPGSPRYIACGDDLSVWVAAADVVNSDPGVLSYNLATQTWTQLPDLPGSQVPFAIALPNRENAWALSVNENAYRYTAGQGTWSTVPMDISLAHIAASSASALWGLDGTGGVHQSSGDLTNWATVSGAPDLRSIGIASDGTVLAVTAGTPHTLVRRETSGGWPALAAPFEPATVAVGGAAWALALSTAGVPYAYDGSTWTQQSTTQIFAQIATAADQTTWAVAADGKVFQRIEVDGWAELGIEAKSAAIGSAAYIWVVLPDGTVLNMTAGATLGLEGTPLEGVPLQHGSVMPRWDTEDPFDEARSTHLWILRRAAQLARGQGPDGVAVYTLVQPDAGREGSDFHVNLYQGLYDADFKSPYNDHTYLSHFCDADSLKNYLLQRSPTALTQGLKFFEEAVSQYQQQSFAAAGYALGLATHYFTDLTQPMHASNFIYGLSTPNPCYHTDLETSVLMNQSSVAAPTQYVESAELSPRDLFIATAAHSKTYWNALLLERAMTNIPFRGYIGFKKPYSSAVRSQTPSMLRDAITATAWFLVRWMQATQAVEQFALAVDPADASQLLQMCCLDAAGNLWHQVWAHGSQPSGFQLVKGAVPPPDIGPKVAIATATKSPQQLYAIAVAKAQQPRVYYTCRDSGGTWTTPWTQISSAFSGTVQTVTQLAAAWDSAAPPQFQVLAIDAQGTLWHTLLPSTGTWQEAWEDVGKQGEQRDPGPKRTVACAPSATNGLMHVVAVAGASGGPWYTSRNNDGSWADWVALNSQLSPNMHDLRDITCAVDAANTLHILVVDENDSLWYVAGAGGVPKGAWSRVADLTPGTWSYTLARAAARTDLFVAGIYDVMKTGHLAHRYGTGSWQLGWQFIGGPPY
jgi:Zinc dependent phospholipase C